MPRDEVEVPGGLYTIVGSRSVCMLGNDPIGGILGRGSAADRVGAWYRADDATPPAAGMSGADRGPGVPGVPVGSSIGEPCRLSPIGGADLGVFTFGVRGVAGLRRRLLAAGCLTPLGVTLATVDFLPSESFNFGSGGWLGVVGVLASNDGIITVGVASCWTVGYCCSAKAAVAGGTEPSSSSVIPMPEFRRDDTGVR
uniref:Uncharacterized protein n=1 Tax=Anopheles coluzzii TaxID=1518534 RepID=A0A8W7PHY5_ANOCL